MRELMRFGWRGAGGGGGGLLARQLDELLVSDYGAAELQVPVELACVICAKDGLW